VIEIRNLMFQPLSLHLAGEEGGIHLGSRERKTIAEGQLSDEIRVAAARGYVSLSEISESAETDPRLETTNDEHAVAAGSVDSRTAARQKRRRER
jgi:hypothetical protein